MVSLNYLKALVLLCLASFNFLQLTVFASIKNVDFNQTDVTANSETLFNQQVDTFKLPGNGIKQHPFVYIGQVDKRHPDAQSIFVVRDGMVVWQYSIPLKKEGKFDQEFSDVTMMSNGNVVYACQSGAAIVTPDKKKIWEFVCPVGTETHSCQPIGKNKVLMVLNGIPAKVLIINTAKNKVLKEIIIPTTTTNPHLQFRHVRITKKNTIMVPLYNENVVREFTLKGKEVWSVKTQTPWSAIRLHNGNTLISGDKASYTREVNSKGETVWDVTQADVPFKLFTNQTANRLANGNTVISNWVVKGTKVEDWPGTVQVFEITPDKKVVWALSEWVNPDLGPNTYIQLLDEPGNPDNGDLQR